MKLLDSISGLDKAFADFSRILVVHGKCTVIIPFHRGNNATNVQQF